VGAQIKAGFVAASGVIQHVREGRLKGLAVSTRARSPLAPDMQTIAEAGYPQFEFASYHVLAAPAGVPQPVAALLEREVLQSLADPDLRERFRAQDIVIAPAMGVEARARIESDLQSWSKVIKAAGMQVD